MRAIMAFNAYDAVPEWARFLTLDEFRAFLATIASDLRGRGLVFQDNDGVLEVACPDGRIAHCGLANIALKCGATGRDNYAREVAQHFDRILGQAVAPPPFPTSFEEVRSIVRVRIYADHRLRETTAKLISRPLADGLTSVAVYDFPKFIVSVSPEHLEAWNITPDAVFRAGIDNVGREEVVRDTFKLGAADIFTLAGKTGFAASQVLRIETHLDPSPLGAIIAVPTRHLLLCYPIKPATVIEALRELVPFVEDLHQDPAAGDEQSKLTTDLYWWRRGELVRLSAGMDLHGLPGVVIAPPQEFIDEVMSKATLHR